MKRSPWVLFFMLATGTAYAVDPTYFSTTEMPAAAGGSSVISFGYIVQLLFSLLVVFGFIYLAAKYFLPRLQSSTKGRIINVEDKVVLEPQVSAYIISAGSSSYLVAVSNKNVTTIDKLEGDLSGNK